MSALPRAPPPRVPPPPALQAAPPHAGSSLEPQAQRDGDGRVVVVHLKTSSRKHDNLQVDASLQLSVYSYATSMNGLGDQEDLRLRFDVLTKTKQPELHRYWTQRDRAASVRLFRLVAEVLHAIEAGVFHPNPGWQCKDCPFQSRCWAWR
jgi:CRISPR/Cas system-associated exonuclease Cas4 (RecB family)